MTTDNYSFLDVAVHAMLCGSREGQIDMCGMDRVTNHLGVCL